MKKTKENTSLNSRVGKSWALNSRTEENENLPDNFIMGMTNQTIDSD
ncbi:hypothetical protein [Arenibacter certesii]|uniref:Uncharacterized protein n=1 Tax=Arenibacter certesii TaxID=228955 RepID=A0A918MLJ4_9FLAO|nr:hypothetical protein [Arenibacter certesii]GGW34597.1 hypothetical protein GCM10007383_19530 [Arenibacter certesii]